MADENVEMEQVPLKSDTDKPAEDETKTAEETEKPAEETAEEKKEKPASKFFSFFSHKDKKKDKDAVEGETEKKEVPEEGAEVTEPAVIIPKEKKPMFGGFFCKKKEKTEDTDAKPVDQMTIGINMLDRDERGINEHVKLAFEDVFGEPDSYYHSWDCVWRLNYRVFMFTRTFFYRLCALICVLPCALIWGLVFAILTVANIWACVPLGRAWTIPGMWIAKTWNFIIRSLFDPCFRSCGLCLSSVTVRRYGMSNDLTADMA